VLAAFARTNTTSEFSARASKHAQRNRKSASACCGPHCLLKSPSPLPSLIGTRSHTASYPSTLPRIYTSTHLHLRPSLLSISFFPHRIHEHCWQIDQKVCRCFCGSGCPCTDSISVGVRKFFNSSIIEKHLCCSISPPTDDEDDLLAEGPPSSDPPTDYEVDLSAEETDRGRPETYEERWPEQAR